MARKKKKIGRILWNRRPTLKDCGDIDEIVIEHPSMVHIEQMHDRCWWIAIYLDDGAGGPYWMGNFTCDSRGRMRFSEQENNNVAWDEDESHEDEE